MEPRKFEVGALVIFTMNNTRGVIKDYRVIDGRHAYLLHFDNYGLKQWVYEPYLRRQDGQAI